MHANRLTGYFESMGSKKVEPLTREELWERNVLEMKARWPLGKVQTFTKLARIAEVRLEYLSRLHKQCPKNDDPSPELCRLCAVLGVIPSSLFADQIETSEEVTTDPDEAANRIAEFRSTSRMPTTSTAVDVETIVKLSSLSPHDRSIVVDLINRLSQLPQETSRN